MALFFRSFHPGCAAIPFTRWRSCLRTVDRCQGALLLLLFNLSHELEDWLTAAARGNLNSLFEGVPTSATLVEVNAAGQPDSASERTVPVETVDVGQYILVKAGQEVLARAVPPSPHITTLTCCAHPFPKLPTRALSLRVLAHVVLSPRAQ